jgi:hypothetical protein
LASRKDEKGRGGPTVNPAANQKLYRTWRAQHGALHIGTLPGVEKKARPKVANCTTQAAAKDTQTSFKRFNLSNGHVLFSNMLEESLSGLGTQVGRSVGLSPEPKQKQFSKRTPKIKT